VNEQVARLYADVGVKISSALRGLREFRTRLQQGQSGLKTLRDQAKITGTAVSTGLTAVLGVLGNKAIAAFGDAEKAMNVFRVSTGATSEEMARASAAVEALAHDLSLPGITKADAANALLELGKAGLSATDSINALRPALLLAEAGELKGAEAAQILAAALATFHLPGTEAARVADLLAAADLRAAGSVREHAEAMNQAATVFAMAGIPIEDLVTNIAQLAMAGIKGSDAGTSLRTMLLRLISPTEEAKGLMTAMGVQIYDTSGRMRDWRDIIGDFQRGLAPLTEAQKNQRLETIFGADAIRAATVIFGQGTKGFDEMKVKVTEAGAAQALATAKTEGLSGATGGLTKAVNTASVDAVKPFEEDIKTLVKALTAAVLWFDSLDEGTKKWAVGLFGFASMLGVVGIAFNAVAMTVNGVITSVSTLWEWIGALNGALAPLGGLFPLVALAAFAVGVIYAWENVDRLNAYVRELTGLRVDFRAIFQNVPIIREIVAAWESLKRIYDELKARGFFGGGGGAVGGSWGPPAPSGVSAGAPSPRGAIGFVNGQPLPGLASGGTAMAGRAYVVGERGPELFVPGASGTVVPNGAGAAVNVNFYGQVFGFSDVKDMIVRAIDEARREGRVA